MGTTFESTKSRVSGNDAAAWGVIAVAVLALGASLVYIQAPLEEPSLAVLPAIEPANTTATQPSTAPAAHAPTAARRAER